MFLRFRLVLFLAFFGLLCLLCATSGATCMKRVNVVPAVTFAMPAAGIIVHSEKHAECFAHTPYTQVCAAKFRDPVQTLHDRVEEASVS